MFSLEELGEIKKEIDLLEIENRNLKEDLRAKRTEYCESKFRFEKDILLKDELYSSVNLELPN